MLIIEYCTVFGKKRWISTYEYENMLKTVKNNQELNIVFKFPFVGNCGGRSKRNLDTQTGSIT